MKKYNLMVVSCVLMLTAASLVPAAAAAEQKKPRIEVVFVLDTTGSMGGLIEGAKMKIWSIANEMVAAKPTPELQLGLVGYRDRSDQYVTKATGLTHDLDMIYQTLQDFQAGGGGDQPESVNQALYDSVTQMDWSSSRDVLKIIFLVGDAPPHMDYRDDVKYPDICKQAVQKDLIINTIQCGDIPSTTPIWQEIARLAEGEFVQISQTGDMTAIETPMDDELNRLNRELGRTAVAYGAKEDRERVSGKLRMAESAPKAAAADRLSFMSKSKKVITGKGDLVADMEEGAVELNELDSEALPEPLKDKSVEEQKAFIQEKSEERKAIQAKIDDLLEKREAYIKKKMAERKKDRDPFDEKVAEMIRRQAGKKGIRYHTD